MIKTIVNYHPMRVQNGLNQYNLTTEYGYDTAGRQILVTDTLTHAVKTEYDLQGRPVTVTTNYKDGDYNPAYPDEDIRRITQYDPAGNAIAQIDPLGRVTCTWYDEVNRIISTTTNYDPNRPQNDQGEFNLVTSYGYNETGNRMLITDTLGRVTRNFYDTTGRLISTTANYLPGHEPNYLNQYNLNTVYGYDESGRQYLVTNTLGFANHTAYDPVTGRPLTTTTNYADGVFDPAVPDEDVAQSTEYDVHGNPYLRRDAGIIALKRAQANLKRYKAAVLKAACEGKLVEQDASDEPASELLARILAERRAKWEDDLRAKGKDPKKAKYEEPKSPDLDELPELPSGWCWVTLDQLMHFMTSGSRGWAKYYAESGALFVRVGNFNRLSITLDLQNPTFVDAPQGAEADGTRLQLNDLLITMTADVGMIGIVDERALQWEEAYINQHVGLVRLVFAELLQFVSWALASESVQVQFLKKQYGATKLGLGFEEVKSIHMPLPPLIEQRRIVAEVERRLSVVQELEGTLTANLARAERLRQAILKRAFEGRLVGR